MAQTPDDAAPQEFRDAHASTAGFSEYPTRRLQLTTPKLSWLGPKAVGYQPKLLGALHTFPCRVVRLSELHVALMLPDLTTDPEGRDVAIKHDSLVARQEARVKRGGPMIGVGASVLAAGVTGLIVAASGSVGIPMAHIRLGGGLPVLSVGIAQPAGGRLHRKRLQKSDAVELFYDRDEIWRAVDGHNSSLRVELSLPDDHPAGCP